MNEFMFFEFEGDKMKQAEYEEREILQMLREDWEAGSLVVVEKYKTLLTRVCARRLQDEEDVKECVNSAFADFCLMWERYEEEKGTLRNYLCTIAERKALERHRKNEARQRAEERGARLMTEIMANVSSEWMSLESEERLAEDMDELLKSMSPLDEMILRKKYYDGMSYIEIAQELEIPYDTVKKRGERGLKKALKRLPESCFWWMQRRKDD